MATKARRRAAVSAGKQRRIQYTVRDVPPNVDRRLRDKAKRAGKSLNALLREALVREAGLEGGEEVVHHDVDHLAGLWMDDPEFDAAVEAQHTIDEDLWRSGS